MFKQLRKYQVNITAHELKPDSKYILCLDKNQVSREDATNLLDYLNEGTSEVVAVMVDDIDALKIEIVPTEPVIEEVVREVSNLIAPTAAEVEVTPATLVAQINRALLSLEPSEFADIASIVITPSNVTDKGATFNIAINDTPTTDWTDPALTVADIAPAPVIVEPVVQPEPTPAPVVPTREDVEPTITEQPTYRPLNAVAVPEAVQQQPYETRTIEAHEENA